MQSVLKKTVASLETALTHNPDNTQLMERLADGYLRLGRFDDKTLELCEKVLEKKPDHPTLQQAQLVTYIIQQADQLDADLAEGHSPPQPTALRSSIEIIDEFIELVCESGPVLFALARLRVIEGNLSEALEVVRRLRELNFEKLDEMHLSLDWAGRQHPVERFDWLTLYETYCAIDQTEKGRETIERIYDRDLARDKIGPVLLESYRKKYDPSRAGEVPEELRTRLLQVAVEYGETAVAGEWLQGASSLGWEVDACIQVHVKSLIDEDQLDPAFELLKQVPMDGPIKELLNTVSLKYEDQDAVDEAVSVLKYINEHELTEGDLNRSREIELARETEMGLAEYNQKQGRWKEALRNYVAALALGEKCDLTILEHIEDILENGYTDAAALVELAIYFRKQNDYLRAVRYLKQILSEDAKHAKATAELQSLYSELIELNPKNHEIRLERAQLCQDAGQDEEALREFKIVAEEGDLGDKATRPLAVALHAKGNRKEALGQFQKLKLGEEDLAELYQLHLDFTEAEDDRLALITLELLSEIRPEYRDVTNKIRQIEKRLEAKQPELTADPKMQELIGDQAIGRYSHLDKLGSGGMGVVHKVHDLRQDKIMAIKILHEGLTNTPKALDRFFREARIAASIHHRNIVEIFDFNISSATGQSYICMEYVDGPSLREVVTEHFAESVSVNMEYVSEMIYYGVQMLDALAATHEKGIVHRDIKPDNIMINIQGEVKITDFGIVHVEDATFTATGAMLGTPRYMSPEQVTGTKIDGRADIYSVGILLYEMLTGSPPFLTGDISYQQVNKAPVPPREITPLIPEGANDFIMKCLEKDPKDRYSSASEARVELAEILEEIGGCQKYESDTLAGEEPLAGPASPTQKSSKAAEIKLDSDFDLGDENDPKDAPEDEPELPKDLDP